MKDGYKKDGERLFTRACSDRTRGNIFKLNEGRFKLDIRKKFFTMKVLRCLNGFPRGVVNASSAEVFKDRVGWDFEQCDLVEDVPAHGKGLN